MQRGSLLRALCAFAVAVPPNVRPVASLEVRRREFLYRSSYGDIRLCCAMIYDCAACWQPRPQGPLGILSMCDSKHQVKGFKSCQKLSK